MRRRNRGRKSLRAFCEIYNPEPFYLEWSDDHLRVIAAIEKAARGGYLQAFAMPRGSGKTTLCRMAILWVASYALTPYPFLINATADKAIESLDAIKTWIRYLPEYGDDFPEISLAAQALQGIANRQAGQLSDGELTHIRWEKDRLVLPRVKKPANLKCKGEWAPTSGLVIGSAGLTGEGIRGSLFTLTSGDQIRPSLVLVDDPQTDESANSPSQNDSRYGLLTGAVLGMAGPGRAIAGVMPCTVIRPDDMADRLLDRKRNPLWRGIRTSLLRVMPANMEAWGAYFDCYRDCMGKDEPDIEIANAHYLAHREVLDAGAEPSWPARKLPGEVSAVQHAMNIYCRDRAAFFAEYQNQPLDMDSPAGVMMEPKQISQKVNGLAAGVVPAETDFLTCFVDVGDAYLFYAVCAWCKDFTGACIEYGGWPPQRRRYFSKADPGVRMADFLAAQNPAYAGSPAKTLLATGLDRFLPELLGRTWQTDDKRTFGLSRLLLDTRYETDVCKGSLSRLAQRADKMPVAMPSMGYGVGAKNKPFAIYKQKPGDMLGWHWRATKPDPGLLRIVDIDTNHFKGFVHEQLLVPMGRKGCFSLYGTMHSDHSMMADHLTAEKPKIISNQTRGEEKTIIEWEAKVGRDNEGLDCIVGCFAAAATLGAELAGASEPKARTHRPQIKLSDLRKRRDRDYNGGQ